MYDGIFAKIAKIKIFMKIGWSAVSGQAPGVTAVLNFAR
jgi:hypothetical protein